MKLTSMIDANINPGPDPARVAERLGGTTLPSAPGQWVWGREGEILACPRHGGEFDLLSGACLTDKRGLQLYEVIVMF